MKRELVAMLHVRDARSLSESLEDERDGYELRRLREALPDGWAWDAVWSPRKRLVRVSVFHVTDRNVSAEGEGATIAEAADRCREALVGDRLAGRRTG